MPLFSNDDDDDAEQDVVSEKYENLGTPDDDESSTGLTFSKHYLIRFKMYINIIYRY